jgi:hypothetical protein
MSRPLLESVVRGSVAAMRNVELRGGCKARGFVGAGDGPAVASVLCDTNRAPAEQISADLFLDATGMDI